MPETRKIYFGTNTKMYMTIAKTVNFVTELQQRTKEISRDRVTLFVIPSFTALDAANRCISPERIRLGAQNMCWEDAGPFTGEISPLMLKEVGVQIVEIGHSERRHVFLETDEMENQKVRCALRHGLTPLLCIGETAEEKRHGLSYEVLRKQLKHGLFGVTSRQARNLMIAYEPVWAIGAKGVPAPKEYVSRQHAVIRALLVECFGRHVAESVPLLYGGSVNKENAVEIKRQDNVDGLFIGRSAWDAANFEEIIRKVLAEA